jgi:hypothetical protein
MPILVVDDEPDVELLFREQLRRDLRAGRFAVEFVQPDHHGAFRAFCLKLNLAIVPIDLTYHSSSTAAPCQASMAESSVALPPV